MNYNDVLKYIIDNLSDYREEIESTLNYIYKYRLPFSQADRGGKLEDTIMSAISDYEVDNDYEHDEILDQLLDEYDLEDIFFDAIDKMDKNVNESMSAVQWQHFDNDDRRYEAYVLIDESDGSIIYNYQVWPGDFWLDILNDAIEDARKEQRHNKYGSYGVYGCMNNEYDESTRVFITNGLNESQISKSDKQILESLVSKYGKSGVNTAISRLCEEVTDSYTDDNGKRHIIWHDEDTDETINIIPDDNDDLQLTPSDDMNFHVDVGDYNYNKSFETLEDALEYIKNGKFAKDKFLYIYDNDYNYYDPETGEIENSEDDLGFDKISDRLIDLQNELREYKQRRKLLMSDMENDPDVINDLDGKATQEYGKQLGEIDEYIEELKDQIRNLSRGTMNEGRLQGYPIPGYKAPYNPHDFDDTDIDLDQIDEREEVIKNELAKVYNNEFPEPGERFRIELTDGWYIILSNCLFEKSDMMGLINVTIGYGKNKEYNYGNGRYYKNIDDMENAIETVLNRTKRSNWYDPYIYNKIEELEPIRYKDYEFKNTIIL